MRRPKTMNIKNPEAHRLAKQLAAATGESLTTAVIVALRERLDRTGRQRRNRATAEEILALGREIARHDRGPRIDHGDLLYDEMGLPK
jgi:antitoxin VapB